MERQSKLRLQLRKFKAMEEFLNKKHEIPYIICSAIWFKDGNVYHHQPKNVDSGIVVAGRRHHNCFLTAQQLSGGGNGGTKIKNLSENGIVQGFLTSDDKFVNRKEAGKIAFDAGQIDKLTECLFSEDLY